MKIVVQPSGLTCLNVGDQAMLEVAYGRLRGIWPQAEIRVLTVAPDAIRRNLPGAIPLSPEGRTECFDLRLFGRFSKPGHPGWKMFERFQDWAFRHASAVAGFGTSTKLRVRGREAAARIVSAIHSTDLFLFSGAGMITDDFADEAGVSLELLHLAKRFGARTAILGHMFGPVTKRELKTVCQSVLPYVDLISVRERLTSLPLLAECGVATENVRVTGDETLEFILENRMAQQSRNALGVNVRASYYSGVTAATMPQLGAAIRAISKQFSAPLEPLAVAHNPEDDDTATLRAIDGEIASSVRTSEPQTARALANRIAGCRIVIVGSYHAAVFALAQGIPAVGLAFGPYYEAKFKGLRDLFGDGCRYVDGTKPGWDAELQAMASDLWTNAFVWQDKLLEAARQQSTMSRAAYQALQLIVDGKASTIPAVTVKPVPSHVASQGA
jgi:polysaccharide pyruvyl transferase WcaK-like protein